MRRTTLTTLLGLCAALLALGGCNDRSTTDDAGTMNDAGGGTDSGTQMDGGAPRDGGVVTDGGTDPDGSVETDGGGTPDAGSDGGAEPDGGMVTDAGPAMVGGGAATSAQIADALAAADGTTDLMINGAVVTYVKTAVGSDADGPGFFLQAEQMGPALYVGVDPATLGTSIEVGQVVNLRVTAMATTGMLRYAVAVDMVTVESSGHSVDFLVQEVSGVDLVTNLDEYAAELITLTADIAGSFTGAGTGFSAAQITSAGVTSASANFRFRVPDAIRDGLSLRLGCEIELGPTPLWRFNTAAQPSAWDASDVTVNCPPLPALADVRINELNANISGGCDLVELRVVSGGSMEGYVLRERTGSVFMFPPGFTVATNDVLVVHFNGPSAACTGGVARPANETLSAAEVPAATVSTNYDTAYDFYVDDTGLTGTDNVISLLDLTGAYVDVVLVSDDPTGSAAGGSEDAAAQAAAAGEWTAPDGTIPDGGFVDDVFNANAVQDLNGTGTDTVGDSIQRTDDLDTNHTGGWGQAASSWGAINVGQMAF